MTAIAQCGKPALPSCCTEPEPTPEDVAPGGDCPEPEAWAAEEDAAATDWADWADWADSTDATDADEALAAEAEEAEEMEAAM